MEDFNTCINFCKHIQDKIKILEKTKFNIDSFLFTVDFESLYTNISVIELLDIVLKNSPMTFDREYFQQFFGIIMGTNLAPILVNLYSAMLQEELKKEMHTWF